MKKKISIWYFLAFPILGFYAAFAKRWITDDAFISFRYAKNLIHGLGLVYNAGERVEGYTNFLWTALVAIFMKVGISPLSISIVLGLFFYGVSLYNLFKITVELQKPHVGSKNIFLESPWSILGGKKSLSPVFFPLALLGYSAHRHVHIFSTSGLETSMFSALLIAGIYYVLVEDNKKGVSWESPLLFILASMTRPDGLLFYCIYALYTLLRVITRKNGFVIKKVLFMQWPLLIFIVYFIWKFQYYGYIFPNTYYAKSGYLSHWKQGLIYFKIYFKAYYVFIFILPLLIFTFLTRRVEIYNYKHFSFLVIMVFLPLLLYLFYYTKIGGDFMFARFYIPITSLLYILLEQLVIFQFKKDTTRFIACFLALVFTLMYNDPYKGTIIPVVHGIVEERSIYKPESLQAYITKIKPWKSIFKENNIRIAIGGSQAFFAYYLEPAYVLEAASGLTDQYIAHLPISKRGQMGHEKIAPYDYLLKKKINLHMNATHLKGRTDYNRVFVSESPGEYRIIIYEKEKMRALKKIPGIEFVDFEKYITNYLKKASSLSLKKLQNDFVVFDNYYFQHNKNTYFTRLQKIINAKKNLHE